MNPSIQPVKNPNTPSAQPDPIKPQLNPHVDVDSFHSSGFAQVAKVAQDNSTFVPDTFEQRRKLDAERKVVGGYRFSNMGRNLANLQAKSTGHERPKL